MNNKFRKIASFSLVISSLSVVLLQVGTAQTEQQPYYTDNVAVVLDRWVGRAAELGIVGFFAIWLLRVLIIDLRSDIKLVTEMLAKISQQAQTGGDEVRKLCNEINFKLSSLLKEIERLERVRAKILPKEDDI